MLPAFRMSPQYTKTMQAILCKKYGAPSDLVLESLADPVAKAGEIVVRVQAAAVNFPDLLMIQNKYQHPPALPFSPGYELAGIVETVGEEVADIHPGDFGVAMIRHGAYAERVAVPAARFWRIPRLDPTLAAAFPLAYGTSYHALVDGAAIQRGEWLLVLGAGGGVGYAAVQLGKLLGAKVIAAASSADKLAACRGAGADEIINYANEDLRAALKALRPDGVDVVLDPVGSQHAEPALRGLAREGRYLVVGFAGGEIPRVALNLLLLKSAKVIGVAWDSFARLHRDEARRHVEQLSAWITEGALRPRVSGVYPLEDVPRALEQLMARQVIGKLVIRVEGR